MAESDFDARLRRVLAVETPATSDGDLNPGLPRRDPSTLLPAAVLVAAVDGATGPRLLLTKRSSRLKHHPGQIAFPGGKRDPGDADAEAAALREAEEEVALPRSAVEILGRLPSHATVTGYDVVPVLARVRQPFVPRAEAGEVDEIFEVPFAHVVCPSHFRVESRRWRGRRRYYHTVPFGPYYIWGATARILRGLADRWEAAG